MRHLQLEKKNYLRMWGLIGSTVPSTLAGLVVALSLLKIGAVILPVAAVIFIAIVLVGAALGAWFGPLHRHHDDGHNKKRDIKAGDFVSAGLILGISLGLACAAFLSATIGLSALPAILGVCAGIVIFGIACGVISNYLVQNFYIEAQTIKTESAAITIGVSNAATTTFSEHHLDARPPEGADEHSSLLIHEGPKIAS